MGNLEILEKAFALADSGEIESIRELRRALVRHGITMTELQQFHGKALVSQLSARIAKAKRYRYKIGIAFTKQ